MKKLLLATMLVPFFAIQSQSNPIVNLSASVVDKDIRGGTIEKGDTIMVTVKVNPNPSTRSIYFDFQHQYTAISLIDVTMATPGASGSAIPAGATTNVTNYFYQNCKFIKTAQNTTSEGWTNYNNASYTCSASTAPNEAINRIYANVSSTSQMQSGDYMYIRFKITNVSAGFSYDSIYMNFAAAYAKDGSTQTTTLNAPRATWVQLSPSANSLITGNVELNASLTAGTRPTVQFYTNTSQPTLVASKPLDATGNFIFSSELQPNTTYRMYLAFNPDSIAKLSQSATTISDYTLAYQEFISQNLDRTYKNTNLNKGVKYKAADVNNSNNFDGSDVQILFNAVAGIDTVWKKTAPNGLVLASSVYDTLGFEAWKDASKYAYLLVTTTTQSQAVNAKYVIAGDVNLSHSSQPAITAGMVASAVTGGISQIAVNLSNAIVTSNSITIPFDIDATDVQLSGLQFEVNYDPSKVKFDKMMIDTPSWVSFVNPTTNTIRFGAVDKDFKNPITGKKTPFKLVFTSVQSGIDLNSQITLTPVYDAADNKGKQVLINLNTTVVKLIGANNFLRP